VYPQDPYDSSFRYMAKKFAVVLDSNSDLKANVAGLEENVAVLQASNSNLKENFAAVLDSNNDLKETVAVLLDSHSNLKKNVAMLVALSRMDKIRQARMLSSSIVRRFIPPNTRARARSSTGPPPATKLQKMAELIEVQDILGHFLVEINCTEFNVQQFVAHASATKIARAGNERAALYTWLLTLISTASRRFRTP
jgi:regulator of replication initiation timing